MLFVDFALEASEDARGDEGFGRWRLECWKSNIVGGDGKGKVLAEGSN
jgi:hypothetical protein